MEIKYGLISCDDHMQLGKDHWVTHMSKEKWGDDIPQMWPTQDPKHMAVDWDEPDTWRWFVKGESTSPRGVANCPTAMQDPKWGEAGERRKYFPQRFSDIPKSVYEPLERVKAMDQDGIDAAILFANDPLQSGTVFQGSAEFELAVVQAYNDGGAEWHAASDRLLPLVMIPYLGGIETTVAEVERSYKNGLKTGIMMLSEPRHNNKALKHFNDPYWNPLWAACENLGIPVHWHGSGGLRMQIPQWNGYTRNEAQAYGPSANFSAQAQFLPNVMFSGVVDNYPGLNWVCAETGLGWVNYILEGCDHEWERRHLWTEGMTSRPSELFHRQFYVDFWYENAGVELRHKIGLKNIMWEADFPHSTATFPESWKFVDNTMAGVPQNERNMLQYQNAVDLYNLA